MLVEQGAPSVPKPDLERAGPREDEITIIDEDSTLWRLSEIARCVLIHKLADPNDWQSRVAQLVWLEGISVDEFGQAQKRRPG